ncbi:MAG TPA: polyprenyl synthetase family protein [Chryseolinea sp.]|nr:polyprenyl synthetase family protein [Chryseolinea sp.]
MIENYSKLLEKEIEKQKYGRHPVSLYEPIRYLMSLGGKRLRPMLTLLAYSLYKTDVKRVLPYAIAVEAFHNFTLMHDDIMDKAPLRRGKPTVHKKWNVNTAILSGDVMLVKVYDMLLSIDRNILPSVLRRFNKCASEVCEGQQWDMEFEAQQTVTEEQYLTMIKLKTAVLLGFSLELGALLAGAPEKDCKSLREFGINIGIGFQLKDDLLDAYADSKKFGKQVGGDIIANKKTFLLIKSLELAQNTHRLELQDWISRAKFNKTEKVEAIKNIYNALSIPELTEKKIESYFKKAFLKFKTLDCLVKKKTELINFTELLIGRES